MMGAILGTAVFALAIFGIAEVTRRLVREAMTHYHDTRNRS